MKFLFIIFLLCINTAYAITQDPYPFTSSTDATRFQSLIKEIRCVVCQNQNIADSNAPLAKDLREKIYEMVLAKQSNETIKNYLVKRYGEFILLQPRFSKRTIVLWIFPVIGLACILFCLWRLNKKVTIPEAFQI